MSEIFFTSDPHYGHANILKYCPRPYSTLEEMNNGLLEEHNRIVGPKDTVWFLGDIVFGKQDLDLNRLNGIKHLILGNHDRPDKLSKYFSSMQHYRELTDVYSDQKNPLVLMHYPILSWNKLRHGAIHLHGHSHGTMDNSGTLRFDVGVDCWDMKPISIDSVLELIPRRKEEAETKREESTDY